jgi:hypothetical protein
MKLDLRMPNITGATEREQLAQIRSYLYQFIPQLQWALSTIDTSSQSQVTQQIVNKEVKTNAPVNAESTFNDIKSLIIKSADIVQAYYEEINSRLYSEYSALSDFGSYTERTESLETKTAEFEKTTYENTQSIENIEGDIEDYRASKGYIQTGIIVKNLTAEEAAKYNKQEGQSLIGVEVGDTTGGEFKKYARFTASRLSFYDHNDTEIAYISGYTLYITHVQIRGSLQEGGYKDFIDADGGIVTKWVGGEG